MTVNVLFAAGDPRWQDYAAPLQAAFAGLAFDTHLSQDIAAGDVDYIVYAPGGAVQDFTPYTRCRAVLNLWAGVEQIVSNPTLTQPLCRMVDPGLTAGMVEWVTGHVLRHHLGMDLHIVNPDHIWNPTPPPLAMGRPVTILGAGVLGVACGRALSALGFPVCGWSRSAKTFDFMDHVHGADGLTQALRRADIVVSLLPETPATMRLLNAQTLGQLPRGAVLINPGRGTVIDDAALIAALDTGRLSFATLDVFWQEPLPKDHPFWHHPQITITPHIASATRPESAATVIADNIRRGQVGEGFLHIVNRTRGY